MSAATFQANHPGLVWSNSKASAEVLMRAALLHPRFHTILDACMEFGLEQVHEQWAVLKEEGSQEMRRVEKEVERILRNIALGFADADAEH